MNEFKTGLQHLIITIFQYNNEGYTIMQCVSDAALLKTGIIMEQP